ncbi:MAG: carbohydrate kinase [Bacteroidales bacterium]
MPSVITIGETLLEIIFRDKTPLRAIAGGSTLNTAVSLSRSNINTIHTGAVGKDNAGEMVLSFLTENNVQTDYIQVIEGRQTPVSLAFLDPDGNAEYQFLRNNAPQIDDFIFPDTQKNDILLMGSWFAADPANRHRLLPCLKVAAKRQTLLMYDLNFRKNHQEDLKICRNNILENIKLAHIIKASSEDLRIVFGTSDADEIFERHFRGLAKILLVSAGADPVRLISEGVTFSLPCPAINPVSTIGAGDSFNAGIISGLIMKGIRTDDLLDLDKNSWTEVLEKGIAFSQQVCLSMENYIPKANK